MSMKETGGKKLQLKGSGKKVWIEYLLLDLAVLIGLILVLQLWNSNITKYPLAYSGDAPQTIFYLQESLEEGPFGNTTRAGAPFFIEALDFSSGGYLFEILRWIVVAVCGDAAFGVNMIFLLGFFLTANISYFVMKKLNISKGSAFVLAILYAFIPYHFLRGIGHSGYSSYWPVPLFLYFCILYMKGQEGYQKTEGKTGWRSYLNSQNLLHLTAILLITGKGIYFAFFACFFLCVMIFLKLLRREHRNLIKQVAFDLVLSIVLFVVNMIPVLYSWAVYGKGTSTNRLASEIETYGLKFIQLILPIENHRVGWLNDLAEKYTEFPMVNENATAALGLVMAIGFIYLLFEILKKEHKNETVYACSLLNIFAFMLATIGGISSAIGLFFTSIRCYNRISIYIGFLAAVASAALLDKLGKKVKNRYVFGLILVALLGFGVYDQTSGEYVPDYETIKAKWDSEKNFVAQIEEMEETGASIFQMPYMRYPENGPINNMRDYSHFAGIFHSKDLKWSYGCYKNREGDAWNRSIQNLSFEEHIKNIKVMGYAGIYVDSYAYSVEDFAKLVSSMENLLNVKPIVSDNGRLYYYTLKNYTVDVTEAEITQMKVFTDFSEGFYSLENSEDSSWRWCVDDGVISIYNVNDKAITIQLTMDVCTYDSGTYPLYIGGDSDEEAIAYTISNDKTTNIVYEVTLEPGVNRINLISDAPTVYFSDQGKDVSFCVIDFVMKF